MGYTLTQLPQKATEREICDQIEHLNKDKKVTGILVFSPLPKNLDYVKILNAIKLHKDIEGRRILHGFGDRVISPTASAVIKLFEETGVDAAGKEAVVIGHSDVVGKPIAILLLDKMATVTICHIKTRSLEEHVRRADIVVSAAGKANLVKGKWIKSGAVVIDVGENILDGKLVGDVEFDEAKNHAGFITPVPGGVGPLTNVMLVKNLLTLSQIQDNHGNIDAR
jgi:methylenetetrahydrofolate dehydrogenase (NADP+)/methenyltetrahydrofolate cyclohydrolase